MSQNGQNSYIPAQDSKLHNHELSRQKSQRQQNTWAGMIKMVTRSHFQLEESLNFEATISEAGQLTLFSGTNYF